jgi:hypothetical protein
VDEDQGIYRGEVLTTMGTLADIVTDTRKSSPSWGATTRRTTKKWTPEQYRAWRKARQARLRELQAHIERIEAELASRQKPA